MTQKFSPISPDSPKNLSDKEKIAQSNRGCLGCLGIVIVGVILFFVLSSCIGGSSSDGNNKYEAIAQCEDQVKSKLKSPATAKFGDTTATGSGTWIVTGTVDSDNSFGATLRSDFQCTVTMNDNKTATTKIDYLR